MSDQDALVAWLRGKLADAQRALTAREQAMKCWASGTDAEWDESAKLHPSTANAPLITKAERLQNAKREEHIAAKCRDEVNNFKAVLSALGQPHYIK